MDIVVSGRNVQITDTVKEAIRQKVGTLDRFVAGLDRADVVFKEERNPRIEAPENVEVTLEGHGHHIRAKSTGRDQLHAVDLAVTKLEKQLRKLKTQVEKRHRPNFHRHQNHHPLQRALNGQVAAVADQEGAPVPDLDDQPVDDRPEPSIVRTKSIELTPMTAEDAALRMELLDHGFFLFCNRDTGRACVVYQRDDGDIGLIEGIGSDLV